MKDLNTDFSLYNNFSTPVMVLDDLQRIVFRNFQFTKSFGVVKNFEKFSNYFNFDICVLDSENLLNANPVTFALMSPENYTAIAAYQKGKTAYFQLTSFYDRGYKVLAFKDITDSTLIEDLEESYEKLSMRCAQLEEENRTIADFRQKAQNQAIKMALIHRVSNVIRESIDISKIVNSTIKELANLFGAIKVYYAKIEGKNYIIENVYPAKFKNAVGEKIEFDEITGNSIFSKNISTKPCLKEFSNSTTVFPSPVTRILVPVYRLNSFLGVLIIFTKKQEDPQNDILQSTATQLASALVQASLFAQISSKNNELEQALNELKETQIQLINSEKMASLGQLVAGVAHEINTPLASINSNNDILSTLISRLDIDDEKLLKTFENINKIDKEAIKRINRIVKSLKSFVRLDESELQEADINKELDLTIDLIHHETKNRIKIVRNYSEIPLIKCYPNMLNQVFMNLLINACHSIENTGEIGIFTTVENNNLVVKIKDNGKGIDDNIKDKIFNAGTTTKKIGTGLGLAITKKIIEKHKGTISFSTQKNKGTEFVVTIPVFDK